MPLPITARKPDEVSWLPGCDTEPSPGGSGSPGKFREKPVGGGVGEGRKKNRAQEIAVT